MGCVSGLQTSEGEIIERLGDCETIVYGSGFDPCSVIKCALFCEDECGWSRPYSRCATGLTTSPSERDQRLGDSPTTVTTTTATSITATTVTTVTATTRTTTTAST